MLLELEGEDIVGVNSLVFVDEPEKGWCLIYSPFYMQVMIYTLICSYNYCLKNLLLFETAIFSLVCQKPLIQEFCFSSPLTVVAV